MRHIWLIRGIYGISLSAFALGCVSLVLGIMASSELLVFNSGPFVFIGFLGVNVQWALMEQHNRLVALENKQNEATVVGK